MNNYSPTWISDNFPLSLLECQYYNICKLYKPGKCNFDDPCKERQHLRSVLENYITEDSLKFQVGLIIRNGEEETEEE